MVAPDDRHPGVVARRDSARGPSAAALAVLVLVVALLGSACGVGRSTDDADGPSGDPAIDDMADARQELFAEVTWERIDERLRQRAADAGLASAVLAVGTGPGPSSTATYGTGELDPAAPLPLAESSFWLTAATLLSLVDEGSLALDAPVGPTLPQLTGPAADTTLRQLLSHTSGLPATVTCATPSPEACDAAIAATELVDPPGEAFHVTDLDAHVAARLAEAATGTQWDELVAARVTGPLGMAATTYADPGTTGGLVAVDGTTTVDDLGRFLSMVRDGGTSGETTVLSPASIEQMLLDQTVRLDTHTEPWVAETGVPTYGLGVWRDRLRGDDVASVVSAPNRWGLYPFVDVGRGAWGVVVVDDRTHPRADVVSQSAVIAQLTAAALRRVPG